MARTDKGIREKGNLQRSGDLKMIFVTVGTHYLGFERLIKQIDKAAGKINEEVIAQIGSTNYKPKNMTYFTFSDEKKISDLVKKSRLVISHGGAGTLLTIFKCKKNAIIVPRLKKFNEAIDDHQLELTEVLDDRGIITAVYDVKKLENVLKNMNAKTSYRHNGNGNLTDFLKEYIGKIET